MNSYIVKIMAAKWAVILLTTWAARKYAEKYIEKGN